MSDRSDPIAVFGTLKVQPGSRDEVLDLLRKESGAVADEPGTIVWTAHAPSGQDDVILVYELYESVAALHAHRDSALATRLSGALATLTLDSTLTVTRAVAGVARDATGSLVVG